MTTIRTIRLMNKQEYEDFRSVVPEMGKKWLLSSTSIVRGHVLAVEKDGLVCSVPVAFPCGVRPAALLTIEDHGYHAGESVFLLGVMWTVFSVCGNDLWVLCDDLIAVRPFNTLLTPGGKNDKWETSTLKTWLEEWLEYTVMGLEDEIVYKPLTVSSFLKETKKKPEKVKYPSWTSVHSDKGWEKSDRVKSYDIDCDAVLNPAIETWTSSLTDDDYKRWSRSETEKMVEELMKLLKK